MGRRVITKSDADALAPKKTLAAENCAVLQDNSLSQDDYMTRIAKYIPAEIITAYIAIDGILKTVTSPSVTVYWVIFAFCLVLTPVYTWRVTRHESLPAATGQIIISTLSFVCWVMAFGGPFAFYGWYQPYIGSIVVILATLVFPLFTNAQGGGNS